MLENNGCNFTLLHNSSKDNFATLPQANEMLTCLPKTVMLLGPISHSPGIINWSKINSIKNFLKYLQVVELCQTSTLMTSLYEITILIFLSTELEN